MPLSNIERSMRIGYLVVVFKYLSHTEIKGLLLTLAYICPRRAAVAKTWSWLFCLVSRDSSFCSQGMKSRWRGYAQRVLREKRATARGGKVVPDSPSSPDGVHDSLRGKVYHQQLSVEVKQMKEVGIK